MTTYRRVEAVRKTVRYEFPAPVEMKALHLGIAWVEQEFEKLNGRAARYDNDYWLEPMDEHVAIVFAVDTATGQELDHV